MPILDKLWVDIARGSNETTATGNMDESVARFGVLVDLMPQIVWSTLPDGYHDFYNQRWYEFTGVPAGSTDGEAWNGLFHADDQERAWGRWRQSLASGEPYEIEYRLRHHSGAYRWVLGRALPVRSGDGTITRWIGTCTDIHDAKLIAEQNAILSRELSHRIKNIFAVINGLIGQSARRHPEARDFATVAQARIRALGEAHEFVRPHSEESRPGVAETTMLAMLARLFAAYPAFDEGRLRLTGEDVAIDDRGATPIALIFHELATNAAKYGALSTADGRVEIKLSRADGLIVAEWSETGGPKLDGVPDREGFGSRLVSLSVAQLGGTFDQQWRSEGLHVTMRVAPGRLVRF